MKQLLNDHSEVPSFNKELEKISPFELKDRLIELAGESIRKMTRTMLNAGPRSIFLLRTFWNQRVPAQLGNRRRDCRDTAKRGNFAPV